MENSRTLPKTRHLEKNRNLDKKRSLHKSRGNLKFANQISDMWATVNHKADKVVLSFLVDDNLLDPNKTVKLNGISQTNNYILPLRRTNMYILHTEIDLTKGDTNELTDWENN